MAEEIIRDDAAVYTAGSGMAGCIHRISWGSVWAGVMIALGMEVLFTVFGSLIGFRMYHWQAANPWSGISAWTAVWYLITAGWSMFFGAWCAARLSGNPLPGDGIFHGITTWGLASVATIMIAAIATWAVLREGINVLGTAAIAAGQIAPAAATQVPSGELSQAARQAGQAVSQMQANAGPMGQATASAISRLSLLIWGGALVGFITAILGGWLGRSRVVGIAPEESVPVTPRRAA